MAANMFIDDEEDEEKRLNLYGILEERNRIYGKKGLIHRMVVISKLRSTDYAKIGASYEKLLKDATATTQGEPASGLLILYPKHSVHILEASIDILLEVVRDLRKDQTMYNGNHEVAKILVISHDIPNRLYLNWSWQMLDIVCTDMDTYDTTENMEKVVIDMLIQIVKLGCYVHKQPKMMQKSTYESLFERVPELLPQQAVVNFLLMEDADCTFYPDEFLKKYETPYDVRMASDLVWPLPIRMFPYN